MHSLSPGRVPRSFAAAALTLLSVALAGCGDDDSSSAAPTPAGPHDCGNGVAATSADGCAFARIVASRYIAQGGTGDATVKATAPATQKAYTLRCRAGTGDDAGVTVCRAADAEVQITPALYSSADAP